MRLRRRRRIGPVQPLADTLPRRGLFAEPVVITALGLESVAPATEGSTVTFWLEVRDAEGRRCPDLAVEARVEGPARTATVIGNTDMLGRLKVRMSGPAGDYRVEVLDVAAGGLDWDRAAGPSSLEHTVTDSAGPRTD